MLGIAADQASIGNVIGRLTGKPAALALDNLETPWEAETLETEALLAELAAAPGLSLTVTCAAATGQPGSPGASRSRSSRSVSEDAKRVFLAIAGDKHAADAQLGDLLAALDGVPLAIDAPGLRRQAEPDLEGLWQRWQTERTAMLKRGAGEHRLLDLGASLELSIKGPRMTEPARRLLSLLGLLPDGSRAGDLETLLPGSGNAAAATLRQVALAFDEAGRLRTLAPIREHAAAHHPPAPQDLAPTIDHYAGLAKELGPKCGTEGGAEGVARLSAERANIERMLLSGLQRPEPRAVGRGYDSLRRIREVLGIGNDGAAGSRRALTIARSIDDELAARAGTRCRLRQRSHTPKPASQRSDRDGARERYEAALPLYRRVGNVVGETSCIQGPGDIALERSDHDGTRESTRQRWRSTPSRLRPGRGELHRGA